MADSKLTNDQAKTLLEKLANDDAFRAQFATKPAAALRSLDIDAETIVQLPAACLQSVSLASKEDYQKLLQTSLDNTIARASEMTVPKMGFTASKT